MSARILVCTFETRWLPHRTSRRTVSPAETAAAYEH